MIKDIISILIKKLRKIVKNIKKYIYYNVRLWNQNTLIESISMYDLIYPTRIDVKSRIEFLKAYEKGGKSLAYKSEYVKFIEARVSYEAVDKFVNKFINLYENIKKDGFKKRYSIEVIKYDSKYPVYLPPNHKVVTQTLEPGYEIFDGAHRLSILIYLGETNIECILVNEPSFRPPDYKSFYNRHNKLKNLNY